MVDRAPLECASIDQDFGERFVFLIDQLLLRLPCMGHPVSVRARALRDKSGSSAVPILLANSRDQVAMSRANFKWGVLELGLSVSQASMRVFDKGGDCRD